MQIEAVVGLQLGLYGMGWLLAAWYVREERRVLLHWAAYALLQGASALLATEALSLGQRPPLLCLVASVLGFVAAVRGVDLFAHGRLTMDRWLLPLGGAMLLPMLASRTLFTDPALVRQWLDLPYDFGLAVLLLGSSLRLWPRLRQRAGTLAAGAALAPSLLTGGLGLMGGILHLTLSSQDMGSVQHAARLPNVLVSLVMSAVFNFGYLFLVLARLIGQLRTSARLDHLTGTLNRRETEARLGAAWARHLRDGSGLAVAVIDVDNFKAINDAHGHARGDEVLVYVARQLQQRTRFAESLGRWGGEEFLLMLPGADAGSALQACERLREDLARNSTQDVGHTLTISVGVAVSGPADRAVDTLVQRADQAMYSAKLCGRNRVLLAAPRLDAPPRAMALPETPEAPAPAEPWRTPA